jgi:hypothetical protein
VLRFSRKQHSCWPRSGAHQPPGRANGRSARRARSYVAHDEASPETLTAHMSNRRPVARASAVLRPDEVGSILESPGRHASCPQASQPSQGERANSSTFGRFGKIVSIIRLASSGLRECSLTGASIRLEHCSPGAGAGMSPLTPTVESGGIRRQLGGRSAHRWRRRQTDASRPARHCRSRLGVFPVPGPFARRRPRPGSTPRALARSGRI